MNLNKIILTIVALIVLQTSCDQQSKTTRTLRKKPEKKSVMVPKFNADSAFYYVEKQVLYGPRVPGTKAHAACATWLTQKLNQYADTVIVQKFRARTYDKVSRNGMNIIASFKPDDPKRVLLMSHWDSRPFADHDPEESNHDKPIDGANDGASGVGVLIEIARQLSTQKPDVGIDIIFFDLEDWGPPTQLNLYDDTFWGLGSQHWSYNPHRYGYSAYFGILLDMVGVKNPTYRKEYFSQQYARYFHDLVWSTAADIGYGKYFLNEDGAPINDDHVHVNRIAKIPSLNIIHLEPISGPQSFFEQWHTVDDNLENISRESLAIVGDVVLTVIFNE